MRRITILAPRVLAVFLLTLGLVFLGRGGGLTIAQGDVSPTPQATENAPPPQEDAQLGGPGVVLQLPPDSPEQIFEPAAPSALYPEAATHYVSTTGADSGTCSTVATACLTVGYAVGQAASGDTISILPGTYAEHLHISKNLTINGSVTDTVTLDGGSTGRVVQVYAGYTVTLQYLVIQNGRVVGPNGAAGTNGNAGAAGDPGTDYTDGGNDGGTGGAGGVGQDGGVGVTGTVAQGAGVYNAGTLVIKYSTIRDNGVTGGAGGDGSPAHCDGAGGCSAGQYHGAGDGGNGGAGGAGGNGGPGGAGGEGQGGGIFNLGSLTLLNTTFSGNWARGGNGSAGGLPNNGGAAGSGGKGGDGDAAGCYKADAGDGGDGANGGRGGNGGTGGAGGQAQGGAIYNAAGATLTVSFVTISHNTANAGGTGGTGNAAAGIGGARGLGGAGGASDDSWCNYASAGTAGANGVAGAAGTAGPNGAAGQSHGGGVANYSTTTYFRFKGSVIAANGYTVTTGSTGKDIYSVAVARTVSHGYNFTQDVYPAITQGTGDLTSGELGLAATLVDDIGPTPLRALESNSAALDRMPVSGSGYCTDVGGANVTTDQRGIARPQSGTLTGSGCDMGAYERRRPVVANQVTTTLDEFGEGTDACSLREMIQTLNTASAFGGCVKGTTTIASLPAGTYYIARTGAGEDNNATGDLDIRANMTITGSSAATTIVDAQSLDRVFHVVLGTAALNNMTIRSGNGGGGDGGGVYNISRLSLSSSTVSGNSAPSGGGIASTSYLTLTTSTVRQNTSTTSGGGVHSTSSLSASGSSILTNTAPTGAGIYNSGTATLSSSSLVQGNTGTGDGAGILNGGTLTLNASTVKSNTNSAGTGGGGIHNTGTLTLNSSSVVQGNTGGSGGGIQNTATGTLSVNSSSILTNTARTDGGGIDNNHTATLSAATIQGNVNNATGAANGGGGIRNAGSLSATGSFVQRNTGQFGGGILNTSAGILNATSTYVYTNTARAVGGGINSSGAATLVGGAVQGNQSTGNSGGIETAGTLTVTGQAKIQGNSTPANGGGMGIASAGKVTISNSSVISNSAASGGGIISYGALTVTDGSNIRTNTATADGGGLYLAAGTTTVILNGVTVQGNTANTDGGGIRLLNAPLTIWDSAILDNAADNEQNLTGSGGGLYASNGASVLVDLRRSQFSGNSARSGGGLVIGDGRAGLTDMVISGNSATNAGGGMWAAGGTVTVTTSTLAGNDAGDAGGGLYFSNTITVTRSTIGPDNHATRYGGGIYGYSSGKLYLSNSTVSGNSGGDLGSSGGGGGIYTYYSYVWLDFVTIASNESATAGANVASPTANRVTAFATVIADPKATANCSNTANMTSAGYNRRSDSSCGMAPVLATDLASAVITLKPLADYFGPTLTMLPTAVLTYTENQIIDVVPALQCAAYFNDQGIAPVDQRGLGRPKLGIRGAGSQLGADPPCDAGAVELSQENRYVCGLPLKGNPDYAARCEFNSVAAALTEAMTGDNIVISGVITETVVLTKSVNFRGPDPAEATPGTHMGIIQAWPTAPGTTYKGPVFTIAAGVTSTIRNLNIRHGDVYSASSTMGGGIINNGNLTVDSVTLYNNRGYDGGAISHQAGALTVTNSTIQANTSISTAARVGIYVGAGAGAASVKWSTVNNNGYNIYSAGPAVPVEGTILLGNGTTQCSNVTSLGYNIFYNGGGCPTGSTIYTWTPSLGALRDNGGPTLTRSIPANGTAATYGPATCSVATDQRGRARPVDGKCDIGAYEYGPQTLTVDAGRATNVASGVYQDLQTALNRAMAGDIINVAPGVYTGSFIAYKDGTIQHAGLDLTGRSRTAPVDVRTILQASSLPVAEQARLLDPLQATGLSGTTLKVQAYTYPAGNAANPVPTGSDVNVTLRGLTLRQGLSRQGGGIYNVGTLTVYTSTIEGNAAVNQLTAGGAPVSGQEARGGGIYNTGQLTLIRSTISGNRSENMGGAIYNAGTSAATARSTLQHTTVAENRAERLPKQNLVAIATGPVFITATNAITSVTVLSGDIIQFESRTGTAYTLQISGGGCNLTSVQVPGMGLSDPLICNAGSGDRTVVASSGIYANLVLNIRVQTLSFTPQGQTFALASYSNVSLARTIVAHSVQTQSNCWLTGDSASISTSGYNVADDSSCGLTGPGDLQGSAGAPLDLALGPLQDNNSIDFGTETVSGYTYSHAPRPASPAVDLVPLAACQAVPTRTINIVAGAVTVPAINAGTVVQWTHATSNTTVVLDDGEASIRFIKAPAGGLSAEVQFPNAGTWKFRAYDDASRAEIAYGTITVNTASRQFDQRGEALPQRGTSHTYACDAGSTEYQQWAVGEALPRPPAALGGQSPTWLVGGLAADDETPPYHMWSLADSQVYLARPSPVTAGSQLAEVMVKWATSADPLSQEFIVQHAIVDWPDDPQIHISSAPANLVHTAVTGGFAPGSVSAFEDRRPDDTVLPLSSGIFTRTAASDASYSVIKWVNTAQASPTARVQAVLTVDWNKPGVRDMRAERTGCFVGRELQYPPLLDAQGNVILSGHEDPEARPGQILYGTAFDGVRTLAERVTARNTVDGQVEPAYVLADRTGPIIPILEKAPTFSDSNLATGGHDLRVAWYRPDANNVAWPVKSGGYRCLWPTDAPEIIIASELGSEVGGQTVLSTDRFVNATVYHQPDPGKLGYSPNWEHALLASSNLGNVAPALYALRTDLQDRDNGAGTASYALLKYRDSLESLRTKVAVYKVVLTRPAAAITDYALDSGTITLVAGAMQQAQNATAEAAPQSTMVLQIGDGDLTPGGRVTISARAMGAQNLRSASFQVTYDATKVEPTTCKVNRQDFIERLNTLQLDSDAPALPGGVVHFEAVLEAGTDARYQWSFGDGTVQIDTSKVSHVYGAAGSYSVVVTATNSVFTTAVTASTVVLISQSEAPGTLNPAGTNGCRIDQPGSIVLDVRSRSKHGLNGNLIFADLTFQPVSGAALGPTNLTPASVSLAGPSYESVDFSITAGNPVYAPTPMRGLLDIQPCPQTMTTDVLAKPFWKDFRGMLWARAAGDMRILYFYPLQLGFHLNDAHALSLGLTDPLSPTQLLRPEDRLGKCVPWMDQLASGTVTYPDFPEEGLDTKVLPVGYQVSWPELPALLTVGETVYERAKGGVSGVAAQMAVSRIYDDLAPGVWDNDASQIMIRGAQVITTLAQLIDPISEVRVPLDVVINGNYSLPDPVLTERRLFGGLAIVGNKDDFTLAPPFSLRSRIAYDDNTGELVFGGYYDGASAEYIKGDPLLLLNVMATSDRIRLQNLCPGGGDAYPYDDTDCGKYKRAVEDLYHKTLNPRELDLCRTADGILDPNGLDDPTHLAYGTALDERVAARQSEDPTFDFNTYIEGCPAGSYRDLGADQDFLIAVQDSDDDGVPEPFEGLGKGKALTAGNAAGTGYVTMAYNNDPSLGGLPVSLQVIKVGCTKNAAGEDSTYRGNLLVIKSDNLFDEKLTLRHTGDFGGRPDQFEFEWYIAAVDDTAVSPAALPPSYPWRRWTKVEPGMNAVAAEITIEGANPTTLSDNWLIMRYKGYCPCGNQYTFSAFAGDPSAKPSEVRAQLAEGWIKRVVNALNPFDTRVKDFVSAPVNTTVSMISQAGTRYEGPIAMNSTPENLNKIGLIEAYQTVLDRGRKLSIDSNVNDQGANAALLNVTSRIADLYMLLANDAYADSLDPLVGLSEATSMGSRAPAIFAFMNQYLPGSFGLIDEELGLLRGRDQTLGGVAAAPTYNRLTWNFTNGDGEVAYVTNYNVKDMNRDGSINEADAAVMYPQGHGDAWGQYLTALTKYYELLRHPNYTWVPRAEPVAVAGAPVVVDYYDERRFAIDAAGKAKVGAEIVNLMHRKNYADPASGAYEGTFVDTTDACVQQSAEECKERAWGMADWAKRAGQGAFFDWAVVNAILPPVDERFNDVRKIDRTTVLEIAEIAAQYAAIQAQLDNADTGANPLGLAKDSILFDLDPALTRTTPDMQPGESGKTHFEQIYDRALDSLGNAIVLFDYANEMKLALREASGELYDFETSIIEDDRARINELIEIFGYPYDADIGVNGAYPDGYSGPDIYNFDLIDRTDITDREQRCTDPSLGGSESPCAPETGTYLMEYGPMYCLGHYVEPLVDHVYGQPFSVEDVCRTDLEISSTLGISYVTGVGLDAGFGRFKPDSWPDDASRQAWGDIQQKMWGVYDSKAEWEGKLLAYDNHVASLRSHYEAMKDKAEFMEKQYRLSAATKGTILGIDAVIQTTEMIVDVHENLADTTWIKGFMTGGFGLPFVTGPSMDVSTPGRIAAWKVVDTIQTGLDWWKFAAETVARVGEYSKEVIETAVEIEMFDEEADAELRSMGREMNAMLREERTLRLEVYLAADTYYGALDDFKAARDRGYRKVTELVNLRKRWAGQIAEMRYGDMSYRMFQTDALSKYRRQFDLAQQYTYLAAQAYDYETSLSANDPQSGEQFLREIVSMRSLGQTLVRSDGTLVPVEGSHGLADALARMRDNFAVLKGQLGFNNPQAQTHRFSLRQELFRLKDSSDDKWRQELSRYYKPDIFSDPSVSKLAKKPFGATRAQPGLVIPFATTIQQGLNLFGLPLGPGDGAYNATQFATKIAKIGVWFDGYDESKLASMPYVYLLPAGQDVTQPRNSTGKLRYWNVTEQLLPVPYPIGEAEKTDPDWIARMDGLNGRIFALKPYASFQAFPYTENLVPDQFNSDTRLIGRSVWNTEWLLVIPGATLLADPEVGIERFVQSVDDIYLYFQTYSYAGTAGAASSGGGTTGP